MLDSEKFAQDGYIIVKGLLSPEKVEDCLTSIQGLEPKLLVPFSTEGWGFGSLKDIYPFADMLEIIKNKLEQLNLIDKNIMLNHLVSNRKPPWIGPEVEYHQEILNYKIFAAGATPEFVKKNWVQIYLPLHDEKAENGGLRILTNTHKLSVLDCQDIISPNFGHKRRVAPGVLADLNSSNEHSLIDLNLNAGDCIFFSTYLVHSSPSNGSPDERISLVSQARPADFEPNQKIFNQEAAFRKDFVTNELMKICEANNKVKKYNEFYKSK